MVPVRMIWVIVMLSVHAALPGCGGGEPLAIENESAYSDAVSGYLRAKSMDLAIDRYVSFQPSDDGTRAEAVIAMMYAGEGAKVKARFRFTFEKSKGDWRVVSHSQVK